MEEQNVKKLSVCVLFGGVSPEHEVSLRSAESVLNNLDKEKYNIFPVGITKTGEWILYGGRDFSKLPTGEWQHCPENRRAAISPVRGQGLLNFEGDCVVRARIAVVFPVLHGEYGEDGSIQGLLQLAGLPYVGPGVAASATCMDKTLTKLVADRAGIRQAAWRLVTARELANNPESVLDGVEKAFSYPMFIKPAGTGSSVGESKAKNREALLAALTNASKYDSKILVEEFINGREVEVAVLGNAGPAASVCGEIDSGTEFYDYDAKYFSDCAQLYIPARIPEEGSERVRDNAIRIYEAMGCRGLSRVDFKGRGILLAVLIATMMIPAMALLIPVYKLLGSMGLVNSYLGIIIPRMADVGGIFLLRQFFISIPKDLDNAARIDGAGEFRIFAQIILPNAVPAILTVGMFNFMGNWNDLLWPLIMTSKPETRTITAGLAMLTGHGSSVTPYGVVMAGALISALPLLIVFFFVQKRFVEGIAMTGMK